MSEEQSEPSGLSLIAREFEGEISPGEMRDILQAVRTLKKETGFGDVTLVYGGAELTDIHMKIWIKPKKKKV